MWLLSMYDTVITKVHIMLDNFSNSISYLTLMYSIGLYSTQIRRHQGLYRLVHSREIQQGKRDDPVSFLLLVNLRLRVSKGETEANE